MIEKATPVERLRGWRPQLVRYAASLTILGAVPIVQFASFLLAGRMLSLEQFGHLILFQASAAILVEVAGGGMSEVLIRNVARDRSSCRQSLLDFVVVGIPTGLLAVLVNALVQVAIFGPSPLAALAALYGTFEICSQRVLILWEQVALAHGHTKRADMVRLLPAVIRLAALVLLLFAGGHTLTAIAAVYVACGVISAIACSVVGVMTYGAPAGRMDPTVFSAGVPFALIQLLRAVQNNFDRIVLKAVLSSADVAIYATAMKFVQVGFLPAATMLRMWYPRIFAAGHDPAGKLRALSVRLLVPVLAAAGMAAAVLIASARLLPLAMGPDFDASVPILQFAAPTLIVTAIGYLGGDVLTGADRPYLRVAFLVIAISVQVAAMVLLSPALGTAGAVVAFYISATLFAALCWGAVSKLRPAPAAA
jgi:O-antigen/teichoic acid export membrane protein